MQTMIRSVQISVSEDEFSKSFSGQFHPFPDDQNIQKRHTLFRFHSKLDEVLRVLRWMKKCCNTSGLNGQITVIYTLQPQ
jgi:hypothetical protein